MGLVAARGRALAPGDRARRLGEHAVLRPLHGQLARRGTGRGHEARSPPAGRRRSNGCGRRRDWGWCRRCLRPGLDSLARGRKLYVYDLDSAAREGTADAAQVAEARRRAAEAADLAAGRRDPGRAGVASRPAGRGHRPGDRRAVEHGRGPAPRRGVGDPAEHPDLRHRRRGRRGAAEHPARRDRGQPGGVRPRPDDPGRRGRGPRAQGRRGDRGPRAADQRGRLGADRQPAGRPGRGRHPQADDVPRSRPRRSASTSTARGSRTPGPS